MYNCCEIKNIDTKHEFCRGKLFLTISLNIPIIICHVVYFLYERQVKNCFKKKELIYFEPYQNVKN